MHAAHIGAPRQEWVGIAPSRRQNTSTPGLFTGTENTKVMLDDTSDKMGKFLVCISYMSQKPVLGGGCGNYQKGITLQIICGIDEPTEWQADFTKNCILISYISSPGAGTGNQDISGGLMLLSYGGPWGGRKIIHGVFSQRRESEGLLQKWSEAL